MGARRQKLSESGGQVREAFAECGVAEHAVTPGLSIVRPAVLIVRNIIVDALLSGWSILAGHE